MFLMSLEIFRLKAVNSLDTSQLNVSIFTTERNMNSHKFVLMKFAVNQSLSQKTRELGGISVLRHNWQK